MKLLEIPRLRILRATSEQENDLVTNFHEIDPISGSFLEFDLTNVSTRAAGMTKLACLSNLIDSGNKLRLGVGVLNSLHPFRKFRVLKDSNHVNSNCVIF